MDTLTKYIAKSTMKLEDQNSCLSFVSTIWRSKPVVFVYDNLNSKLISHWFEPEIQDGDLTIIEDMLYKFLN